VRRFKSRSAADNNPGGDDQTTEIAAVRLLSRREHSTRELKRKLAGKGHEAASVDRVVDQLADKELVSDERFATSFVTHHGRRGHGPVRIRAELRQQGASDDMIAAALAAAEFDWSEIAASVRQRKFGNELPRDRAERAKQARFLQYRGFSADQIRAAMATMAMDSAEPALPDSDFD